MYLLLHRLHHGSNLHNFLCVDLKFSLGPVAVSPERLALFGRRKGSAWLRAEQLVLQAFFGSSKVKCWLEVQAACQGPNKTFACALYQARFLLRIVRLGHQCAWLFGITLLSLYLVQQEHFAIFDVKAVNGLPARVFVAKSKARTAHLFASLLCFTLLSLISTGEESVHLYRVKLGPRNVRCMW